MRYSIRHVTHYNYTEPVPVCHNLVHLAPRTNGHQACRDYQLAVEPVPKTRTKRFDFFGNEVDYFSIQQSHEGLAVTATSIVDVNGAAPADTIASPGWEALARTDNECQTTAGAHSANRQAAAGSRDTSVVIFQLPSPNVSPAAALGDYARASFTAGRPIFEAVRDLTGRIHAEFAFDPEVTTVYTSPEETLQLRRGVCQDFAHLEIGCLRSLGLAARYVSGYVRTTPPPGQPRLQGADASHAWLSVYCGDELGWVDFDPTNDCVVSESHVTIGWGRDYGDLCPIQGVFVGGGDHNMSVSVDVILADES